MPQPALPQNAIFFHSSIVIDFLLLSFSTGIPGPNQLILVLLGPGQRAGPILQKKHLLGYPGNELKILFDAVRSFVPI